MRKWLFELDNVCLYNIVGKIILEDRCFFIKVKN